jgi:hypothetical protein
MSKSRLLHLFTFKTPIIYDNSALQAELLIYKGDLSVKSNSYLITFKDADPLGSAFHYVVNVKRCKKLNVICSYKSSDILIWNTVNPEIDTAFTEITIRSSKPRS